MMSLRLCDNKPPPPPEEDRFESILKHIALAAMASILITYSATYMPDSDTDFNKQYVSSICIFAVIMAMKDSDYFFPDATPMTTTVLYAATLYTDAGGNTDWNEIIGRIVGQVIGFATAFYICIENKENVNTYGMLAVPYRSSSSIHSINEGIGTMIEGIAIAYATIPLISPYDNEDGLQSKSEAVPPDNASLCVVALSLSSIHYTLERLFQGTMNPLITIMQNYLQGGLSDAVPIVICQCIGLFLATMYIKWCIPSKETLKKLRKKK